MASDGPNSPGTVVNDSSNGGSGEWRSPDSAKASDDSRADCEATAETYTQYLKATDFGFSIPGGATINGIFVTTEGQVVSGVFDVAYAHLVLAGTPNGSYERSIGVGGSGSDANSDTGAEDDLWDASLTASDINDSGFGVAFQYYSTGGATIAIDHVVMTVYYTDGFKPGLMFACF